MIKTYYQLTKPGIIYGNLISLLGGFLFASAGLVNSWLLVATAAGTALIMASGCVFNNIIDKDIDAKMDRTSRRALVIGSVSTKSALFYASVLWILGFILLVSFTNFLTVAVGAVGFIDYVVLYGITKRKTVHGTLVGTIAGATPLLAGYTAVTNQLDTAALTLFAILALWQMAHFYSIAIFRLKDYKRARLPMMSVVYGVNTTVNWIIFYIVAFIATTQILNVFAEVSYFYIIITIVLGSAWLLKALKGLYLSNHDAWARQLFVFSLYVLLAFNFGLATSHWLP